MDLMDRLKLVACLKSIRYPGKRFATTCNDASKLLATDDQLHLRNIEPFRRFDIENLLYFIHQYLRNYFERRKEIILNLFIFFFLSAKKNLFDFLFLKLLKLRLFYNLNYNNIRSLSSKVD